MHRGNEGMCVSSWLTLVILVCVTLRDLHFQKSPYPPLWMRIALWSRSRVRRSECASRGGVRCRGAGGVGVHAIFVSGSFFLFVPYTLMILSVRRSNFMLHRSCGLFSVLLPSSPASQLPSESARTM